MAKTKPKPRPAPKRNHAAKFDMVVSGTGTGKTKTLLTVVAIERVEALARTGMRQVAIASLLGIDPTTWDSILARQPEVASAFAVGRAAIEQELVEMLVAKARDGNLTAIIFSLKNIAKWSDHGIQGEAPPAVNVNINIPPAMTNAEFQMVIEGAANPKGDRVDRAERNLTPPTDPRENIEGKK